METINLIGNTGIQFYDLTIKLADDSPGRKVKLDFYDAAIEHEDEVMYYPVSPQINEQGKYEDPKTHKIIPFEDQIYTIKASDALQCFEGMWLPLPYFRRYSDKKLHDGPTTWARFWYNPVPNSSDYKIVLAFDTKIEKQETDQYLTPTERDTEDSPQFKVAVSKDDNEPFIGDEWVDEWITRYYDQRKKQLGLDRKLESNDEEQPKRQFVPHTLYMTLLKALDVAGAFPIVELLPENKLEIEVDMILDIGNSRSCGLLIETPPDKNQTVSFTKCSELEIRDLSIPDRVYHEPFEMHCEFADASFGDRTSTSLSGNPKAFFWPGLVRIGQESVRLSVINDSTTYPTGMSSPKRYLWDKNQRELQWIFNSSLNTKPISAQNDLSVNYFKSSGELLTDDSKVLLHEARYSRSSVMVFAIIEIILHALSQVNSYKYRKFQGNMLIRRKLKRLVVTCPTAMPETEKYILRKHAQDAVDVLKKTFREYIMDADMKVIPEPTIPPIRDKGAQNLKKDWNFDEATCVQLAYLYGEIYERFSNNAKLFFKTMGRLRKGSTYPGQPSLVVGSLDIGGGTTDLMICNYQIDPAAITTVLAPKPLFWEGFNNAGDNILKRIIERIVLPKIRETAEQTGCQNAADVMNFLFGHSRKAAMDSARQKQFACQIALPVALSMVQHASDDNPQESRKFNDFFIHHPYPHQEITEHVNRTFRKNGAESFRIQDMKWILDTEEINQVVRQVVQPMLGSLCGVISQYKCDCLILAGRPTIMPVFRDILLQYLPLSPDRIVLMGRYRIGKWYPFAKGIGLITDPKTCVCVGASVALMGGTLGRLEGFRIDTQHLKNDIRSTANYIGAINPNTETIEHEHILFRDDQDEAEFRFDSQTFIGMRQMDSSNWMATPLYRINYSDLKVSEELRSKLPLKVTLWRRNPDSDKEMIILKQISDREDRTVPTKDMTLSLQTLFDEKGYWLDSGSFQLSIF